MLQISKPIDTIIKMVGKQNLYDGNYRTLLYTIAETVPEGLLLYNLMTKELLLLNNEESLAFSIGDFKNPILKYLIENWFIVPEDNNDLLLQNQINSIFKLIAESKNSGPLKNFVIFPTTDCNARCFYCFELGHKRINMSDQTAHDVSDFIEKHSAGQSVHLMWFGGEPLFNLKAIDIITNDLKEKNIEYVSEMISNGYLFDEETVAKAVLNWNLKDIQITLDGTEEIYNRCKAYIYKNAGSPFKKVLDNIELLLENKILVRIRLNIDLHNCDDLRQLIEYIFKRFNKYDNLLIYLHPLFENTCNKYNPRNLENKILLSQKIDELNDLLIKNGKLRLQYSEKYRSSHQCMADDNFSTTILPDGSLGKCEHFTDENFYGSIYNEYIDFKYINKFKEKCALDKKCNHCKFLPKCICLKACPIRSLQCDEFDKLETEKNLKQEIKNSFEYFKKIISPTKNGNKEI